MKLVTKSLILAVILAATPASAGKADKTAFRISISMEGLSGVGGVSDLAGGFRAHGAISSTGSASAPFLWNPFSVLLVDDRGTLTVVITDWTVFQITDGTGAYEGLSGGGSASLDLTYLWPKGTTGREKRYGAEPDRARVDLLLEGNLG